MRRLEDDDLDENGVLKDKKRMRVPMSMMDSQPTRRPRVTDADGGTLGLHRPGFRIDASGNEGDAILRHGTKRTIYDDYDAAVAVAYKNPDASPEFGPDPEEERPRRRTDGLSDHQRLMAEEYARYEARLTQDWRRTP